MRLIFIKARLIWKISVDSGHASGKIGSMPLPALLEKFLGPKDTPPKSDRAARGRFGEKEAEKALRKAGLKVTLPRVKILQILEASDSHHMSAEDVYKALLDAGDDVGLATVYRVLTQFESAGLVSRLNFDGGHAVFELDKGDHHDHMVCVDTGQVIEFVDEEIEVLQHAIAEKHGFDLVDHNLVLYVKPKK